MPPKFFITHSHKDNAFVAKLARDLRATGFDGFLDIYSLKPGDLISREISRGLEACDYYLPVLSHAAMDSPWCELEIHTAITLSNEAGRGGRPRIIPLLVEECQARLDPFLRARLYLKFHENYDANFLLLLRALGVSGPVGGIDPSAPLVQPQAAMQQPATSVVETKPEPKQESLRIQVSTPEPRIITPPRKIEIPARRTNKAGKEMILILAGEFLMGSDKYAGWKPIHQVYLDAFYISRYPVTNVEYIKFKPDWNIPSGKENHPVVNVSWDDATVFCKWLTEEGNRETGKQEKFRLPTEAEWEKAASWDDAQKIKRVYPWGDAFDENRCNTGESGIGDTTTVGKYSPHGDSFYGVSDMAGNVWEWCADWFDENYYSRSPRENPQGPDSGNYRVVRGGSFDFNYAIARCAYRYRLSPDNRNLNYGFRVVASP